MRAVVVAAAVLLAAAVGCGTSEGAPSQTTTTASTATSLTTQYWAQGVGKGAARTWTLRCNPAAGTLPRAAAACVQLGRLKAPFAPIPPDVMCTEQYGGPQVAIISGTFRGKRLWVKLQNRNGCEIARFQSLSFLVPAYGSSGPA